MPDWHIEVVGPDSAEKIEEVRELFTEYHAWLQGVVATTKLGEDIVALPGAYASPKGRLLLARDALGRAAGVVGLRPFGEAPRPAAELKRLYVRPGARNQGIGRRLAEEALDAARELGYEEVLLTTLPADMGPALSLYRSLGFRETEPFADHSYLGDGVTELYMRLDLGGLGT